MTAPRDPRRSANPARARVAALLTACLGSLAACGGGGGTSANGGNTDPGLPQPTNTFAGSVTYGGAGLPGATVIAFNTNSNSTFATTTTDANGHYSFAQLGTSCTDACTINYQFWVTKAGYAFEPVVGSNPSGDRSTYAWYGPSSTWYASTGAAVTRADYTGQFSNPGQGSAYLVTVLNFNSVANGSVLDGNFVAVDGANAPLRLAASGQLQSYAPGDAADLHAGVAWPATRYVDNHDGTVSDHLTGLVWLKDAGCLAPATWADAIQDVNQLASGACGLADGSAAGAWRMPNQWELESIVDESASAPAITAGSPFVHVTGTYWTSTSYYGGETGSPSAWAIRMDDGRYINDGATNLKAAGSLGVWAVKGRSGGTVTLQATGMYVPYAAGDDGSVQAGTALTYPRMRDNRDGTLTDTVTGLVWLRQASCLSGDWNSAVAAVRTLASGQCGLADGSSPGAWRMPDRKEMASLADRGLNNQADFFDTAWTSADAGIPSAAVVFDQFVTLQYYWTSSTDASDPSAAWTVFSCDYGVYDTPKSATGYTLAVRG
jgi:hypothetical protein